MKRTLFLLVASLCMTLVADVSVTAVEAHQRYPWNGLVDIAVTLQGTEDDIADAEWSFAATNSATKAALSVVHIAQNGMDSGSGTSWTRRFIWDTNADLGEVKIEDVALTVEATVTDCVQLWENGPYWAKCNVGAEKPEDYGYYFWWGDTVGYKREGNRWNAVDGSRSGFTFSDSNCPTDGKSTSQLKTAGYIDESGNLIAAYDAATAHLGAPWRMPTAAEFSALSSNCTTTWTTQNGVNGQLFRGKRAFSSKSIFLPAAGSGYGSSLTNLGLSGDYWSSTPIPDYSDYARALDFDSSRFGWNYDFRFFGNSVRPLRGFVPSGEGMQKFPEINAFTALGRDPVDGQLDFNLTISAEEWPKNAVTLSFDAVDNAGGTNLVVSTLVYDDGQSATISAPGNYHVVWDAAADLGRVTLTGVTITAVLSESGGANRSVRYETSAAVDTRRQNADPDEIGGVQLWEDGPYWAECNVGAKKPEEYGYYFWWGDTVGYKRNAANDGWVSVKGGSSFLFGIGSCPTYEKSSSQLKWADYIDQTGNLAAVHDAATAHLGAPWRMPTDAEFSALISNCTTTWTTRNGVFGRLVTGKGAFSSKSIFLPAAGYGYDSDLCYHGTYSVYWSSTPLSGSSCSAWSLDFHSSDFRRYEYCDRFRGQSVRPLRGFAK